MVRMDGTTNLVRWTATAAALLFLNGCFVMGERFLVDEPLDRDFMAQIRRGATTVQEVIERFGPPTAAARRGETMVYPPPGRGKQGRADIQSDAFFELFPAVSAPRDGSVVYYYDSSRVKGTGFIFVPLIGGGYYTNRVVVERLWLLVDESTGIVEDYVFRGGD